MELSINRKSAVFRLREELLKRLKLLAALDNRSLNNYVETVLMDVAFLTPNATTRAAMKEAQDDSKLAPVKMDSFEDFFSSMDIK